MTPFTTTDKQKLELYGIASQMLAAGLPASFIVAAVRRAEEYEGSFDLLMLWRDVGREPDGEEEREQIVADIQELIDEHEESPPAPRERPYVQFDDLKSVADRVTAFKAELRKKVDAWGGITKLARETDIPQPSLSRFFGSASMPRRTTLYKIAKALDLAENDIATDWLR
jgi:hypothetical protein